MATFELRRGTFGRDPSWRMNFYFFDVRSGAAETTFVVGLSDQLRRRWGLSQRANADDIERRAAVGHLKGHLASIGLLPRQGVHHLLLTAGGAPEAHEDRTVYQLPHELPYEWKECRFQKRGDAGPVCAAAVDEDLLRGRTTRALCERCGLPSTDILCSNLAHVGTVGLATDQTGLIKRSLVGAQCNIGSEEFSEPGRDAKLCVPGGLGCWVQTYNPAEPVPTVAPSAAQLAVEEAVVSVETRERNLAAEVLNMADTLNTIFSNQFAAELFRLKQFRTGRVLMESCTSEEGFAFKLQVLGDLIDLMNSKELGEAQGVTSEPGSVNWLAAFLERVGQRDPAPVIQTLRDIRTLRKQLAAHSAATDHFVQACERLGIDLPIADYEGAWYRVLTAFLQALRRLQALIR